MSVLAPRGVTQARGSSGLVGLGMGPESAWLDKEGEGRNGAPKCQRVSCVL